MKIDLIKIVLIAILFLFIGLIINFYFMLQVPEFYLIRRGELDSFLELGPEPIIVRFVNYLVRFFTGDWLNSETVYRDSTVFELLKSSIPRMIEIMIIPLILGFILGKLLKRILIRKDHKYLRKIFTVLGGIGVATPIFWVGFYLQIHFVGLLAVNEWQTFSLPYVTGFLTLDSMFAGYWEFSLQIFMYMILPILFLTLLITALTAKKVMPKKSNSSKNDSIITNSLQTGMIFSLVFTFYILTDITFDLRGISYTIIMAFWLVDSFLLEGCVFIIIILFVICTFISNLYFILKSSSDSNPTNNNQEEDVEGNSIYNLKEEVTHLKNYFLDRLKSPFCIAGAIIVVFLIILAIFPQIITPYTLSDITFPAFGGESYAPASPEHPLGTAHYGYDLSALVIWGIRDLLASGGWIVLIGLVGGLPFGILASKFNRSDKQIILFVMSFFFIIPSIIVTIFMLFISELDQSVQAFIIGILLIPMFTRKIAYTKPKFTNILKELIIFIPCVLIFANLLYTSTSFLGFADIRTPQLGYTIHKVYSSWNFLDFFLERYFAIFWSGLAIFTLNFGLFLIYIGLNSRNRETQ